MSHPAQNTYVEQPKTLLKVTWGVIMLFSIADVIVSIAVASANNTADGGYKGLGFSAIWSMFLVLAMVYLGTQAVRSKTGSSPLFVGFLIGFCGMLAQLFFFLACVFFTFATDATTRGYNTAPADNAFGSFAFFNFLLYGAWAFLLASKRASMIDDTFPLSINDTSARNTQQVPGQAYAAQKSQGYGQTDEYEDDSNI